jgi:hypothetical protein
VPVLNDSHTDSSHVYDRFLAWCRIGPPKGQIAGGEVSDKSPIGKYIRECLKGYPLNASIWCLKIPGSLPRSSKHAHFTCFGSLGRTDDYSLQAWWALVFLKDNPLHGELQRDPLASRPHSRVHGSVIEASDIQLKELRSAMNVARKQMIRGRPVGTITYSCKEEFIEKIFPLINRHGSNKDVVCREFGHDPRQVLRWIKHFGWPSWTELVRDARRL